MIAWAPTKSRWYALVKVIAFNVLVVLILSVAVESSFRWFSDITYFGNSKNLFHPAGPKRNNPNTEAVSYGQTVTIDRHGYRVPFHGYQYPEQWTRKIAFIGDSITFGPGVAEEKTFVGLMRRAFDSYNIINTAVTGHYVLDYERVLGDLVEENDDITDVVVVFCLNDVDPRSAVLIDQQRHVEHDARKPEVSQYLAGLKRFGIVSKINAFLRSRSKFYIWLKGVVTDPSRRYYQSDMALYDNRPGLVDTAKALRRLRDRSRRAGATFTLIVPPYEYQMRRVPPGDQGNRATPQDRLSRELARQGVAWIDARRFLATSEGASDSFLRYDPMHFSETGHLAFFRGIKKIVTSIESSALSFP